MSNARDERIVSLALESGLLTPEQVEACRKLQLESGAAPPPSLLQIIIRQGHLTSQQVVGLVSGRHLPDLERCALVRELGSGPLGTTCVLEHEADGRRYVVKVLHPRVQAEGALAEQIRRDAAVAAGLEHPHLVRTLGAGEKLGDTFVVSEYLEGASLQQLLDAKGRLDKHEVVSVALACAQALGAGLRSGLLHGALSPGTVLVAQDGTVKVADLGLTKPPVVEVSLAEQGEGARSPHYLSPEHLDRQAALDTRSDLFSLGSVLYRCLTGEQAFQGDTTGEVKQAIRHGAFLRVKDAAPDAPQGLAAIIEKLLAPDPARRYQTPDELLADLEALQAGKVPEALRAAIARAQEAKAREPEPEPEEPPEPAAGPEPAPRRRWPWVAAAVAGLVAIVGGVWLATRPPPPKPKDEEEVVEADPNDPVLRAKQGRAEIAKVVAADTHEKAKSAKQKATLLGDTIRKLEDIEKRYQGTEAAAEAKKRLAPLQAEALFQAAFAQARAHPASPAAAAERYRQVVERFPDTAAALKAEQELDKLEGAERKKIQRALGEARQRADRLAAQERFGEALRQFDPLLRKAAGETTRQLILQERIAITSKAEQAYERVHELAQEKVRGRYFEEARALYARVVDRFGVEPYVGRANAEIAIIKPLLASAAKRRVEAVDAAKYQWFLMRLEPSLALARGWRLDEAVAAAETLRPELREARIEGYLDDYLADLGLLDSLKRQVIKTLNDQTAPVTVSRFSLGKVEGKFDRLWYDSRVVSADAKRVLIRYGQVDVRRSWDQFAPDELYKLGVLALDPNDKQGHLLLAVHCLYAGIKSMAARELNLAQGGPVALKPYENRVKLLRGPDEGRRQPTETEQEEASRLLMEAKRLMTEREWDRALYRLALLRERHAKSTYDVSANLDDIHRRIVECKRYVDKLEMETDLALGRRVALTREGLWAEWQRRFGTWSFDQGLVRAEVAVDPKARGEGGGDQDAECLFSLTHPPTYELRVKVRVVKGMGALLRLAGKARPNLGFWIHAQDPKLVGLLRAYKGDEKPAEHTKRPFAFKLNTWYEIRALVNPAHVEVAIGDTYVVRTANTLAPDPKGIQTYGFLVNPRATAEFRDFSVRVLQEQ